MVQGRFTMAAIAALALLAAAATRPAEAHNDWGLPLVGGLVGGYALKSFMGSGGGGHEHERSAPAPAPPPAAAPAAAPAPAADSASSIEQKLNTLDQLAAKGYITKDEYNARRQALLNQL